MTTRDWILVASPHLIPAGSPQVAPVAPPTHPTPLPEIRAGEVLIDETEPSWRLFDRPAARTGAWHSLVLRRTGPRLPKRAYWFGWNGQRVARNHDAKILFEHNPEIFAWVEIACSSHQWELER